MTRIVAIGAIAFMLWLTGDETGTAEPSHTYQQIDLQPAQGSAAIGRPQSPLSSLHAPRYLDVRIRSHIKDADQNCLRIDDRPATRAQAQLDAALQSVRQSELGQWLVQIAKARDVVVCVDHETTLEAHYRSYLGLLGLNSRLDAAGKIVFLAHELAHVPQHPRFSNNRNFSPRDMLLLQRTREAAAEAVATRVLWQLREQGLETPWQRKLTTAYHDIARAFEASVTYAPESTGELEATRRAFLQWFEADWRLDTYDDLMMTTLARIAQDSIGLVPASRRLSDPYLQGIAHYGFDNFLQEGDGQRLIDHFQNRGLSPERRAKLETILFMAEDMGPSDHRPDMVKRETLSAINPEISVTVE
jgi:hypothetical protein